MDCLFWFIFVLQFKYCAHMERIILYSVKMLFIFCWLSFVFFFKVFYFYFQITYFEVFSRGWFERENRWKFETESKLFCQSAYDILYTQTNCAFVWWVHPVPLPTILVILFVNLFFFSFCCKFFFFFFFFGLVIFFFFHIFLFFS